MLRDKVYCPAPRNKIRFGIPIAIGRAAPSFQHTNALTALSELA